MGHLKGTFKILRIKVSVVGAFKPGAMALSCNCKTPAVRRPEPLLPENKFAVKDEGFHNVMVTPVPNGRIGDQPD